MREQVPERHLGRAGRGLDPEALQEVVDRVVELEQPFVAQLHHADRGERLRDRRDAEHRVGVDRPASDVIGQPETFELGRRVREYHCGGEPTQAVPPPRFDHQRAQVGHREPPVRRSAPAMISPMASCSVRKPSWPDDRVTTSTPLLRGMSSASSSGAAAGRAGRDEMPGDRDLGRDARERVARLRCARGRRRGGSSRATSAM